MIKKNKIKNNFIFLTIIFFFFAVLIYWLIFFVPSDSDELLAYYNIACKKLEGSRLAFASGYYIGCENFKLNLFGYEYTKSYSYLGLSSIFFYSPFYSISPNIISHYIYGLFFLFLFSFLLTKSLNLRWQFMIFPLLYFPLSFLFLHDTGPIKIAMLTLPILIIIFKKIIKFNSLSFSNFLFTFLASIIVVIGLEDKAFYLFLLPSFVLCAFLISLNDMKKSINFIQINKKYFGAKISKNILILGSFFLIVVSIAILFLFIFSTKYVQRIDFNVPYIGYLYAISPKISFLEELNYLFLYTFIPISFADRIFEIDKSLLNIKNLLSFFSFLPIIIILIHYIKKNTKIAKSIFFVPTAILILIFLVLKNTWSGHHFIFLHLFFLLLLMFYANINTRNFIKLSGAFVLCSIVSMTLLTSSKINIRSSKEITEISTYLNRPDIANNSIINFSSWGGYLQQSIYGHKLQIVSMTAPINVDLASKVNNLRIKKNREYILNVCHSCSESEIKQMFSSATNVEIVRLKTNIWKVLKVSYE